MLSDLRLALRLLAKAPGFTASAICALALGIGANTAIFSVLHSVFLRPLPYADSDRLVRISSTDPAINLIRTGPSWPRYRMLADNPEVFSAVAAGAFNGFTLTGRGDPEQLTGFHASANYLSTLGVQPQLGRGFNADEDRPGGPDVVLLSHTYWQHRLGGRPAVLGESLTIDGRPHEIVGVLPPALSTLPFDQTQVWLPRPAEVNYLVPAQLDQGAFGFHILARLRPGISLAQARTGVALLDEHYRQAHPKHVDAPSRTEVVPVLDDLVGAQRPTYALLFAAVGCVLLIACANVANLLLARFIGRRKEIALRFALGAGRARLVRQLLAESLVLALAGGLLGLLVAQWSLAGLLAAGAGLIPRASEIALDSDALAFGLLVALATGLAMGLLPACQASAANVNEALKDATRGSTGGARSGLRDALLVGEIALALVLLIAAGLLCTSFIRMQRASAGFEPSGVLVTDLALPFTKYEPGKTLAPFHRELHRRLSDLPGVRSAALTDRVPLVGNTTPAPVAVSGRPLPPLSGRATASRNLITPGFFRTLGIPLPAGRDFDERDTPQSPHVVIVNEAFVRQHFPGEQPLGRTLITGMGQLPAEIVGVVADIRATDLRTPPRPEYYLPALQRPENFTSILLRTEGDPLAFLPAVRAAVAGLDPDLPLLDPRPLPARVARTVADRRLGLLLLGAFAGLALGLASLGVYSVIATVVGQRTAEIGIRMALGATPSSVLRLVLAHGLRLAGVGIAVGLGVALAVARLVQGLLFEVEARDPLIYASVALVILLVAAFACLLPARRATRIAPIVALRAD